MQGTRERPLDCLVVGLTEETIHCDNCNSVVVGEEESKVTQITGLKGWASGVHPNYEQGK